MSVECPYCGERIDVFVDTSVDGQRYIEDCQVCCRPINFCVTLDEFGYPIITVSDEDE